MKRRESLPTDISSHTVRQIISKRTWICNDWIFYLVVGLGFGMMSGAFSLINVLADSAGPGTVGMRGEHQDFFMVSAVMCLGTILLHTFWGVITFDALNRRKWLNLAFVWASHFTVSCLVRIWCTFFSDLQNLHLSFRFQTLLNERKQYWASAIPMYIVLFVSAFIAFRVSGGQFQKALLCLKCSKPQQNVEVQAPAEEQNSIRGHLYT